MHNNPIDYRILAHHDAHAYGVVREMDQRAERFGQLPSTPGVMTEDDVAALSARDPEAVALIRHAVSLYEMDGSRLRLPRPTLRDTRPRSKSPPRVAQKSLWDRL
jgi:hypothetical protein